MLISVSRSAELRDGKPRPRVLDLRPTERRACLWARRLRDCAALLQSRLRPRRSATAITRHFPIQSPCCRRGGSAGRIRRPELRAMRASAAARSAQCPRAYLAACYCGGRIKSVQTTDLEDDLARACAWVTGCPGDRSDQTTPSNAPTRLCSATSIESAMPSWLLKHWPLLVVRDPNARKPERQLRGYVAARL